MLIQYLYYFAKEVHFLSSYKLNQNFHLIESPEKQAVFCGPDELI